MFKYLIYLRNLTCTTITNNHCFHINENMVRLWSSESVMAMISRFSSCSTEQRHYVCVNMYTQTRECPYFIHQLSVDMLRYRYPYSRAMDNNPGVTGWVCKQFEFVIRSMNNRLPRVWLWTSLNTAMMQGRITHTDRLHFDTDHVRTPTPMRPADWPVLS